MIKEKIPYFFALIISFMVVIFLQQYKIEPFESFSLRFNDSNFNLIEKEPYKELVFVAVDEKSINNYGRWPWGRDVIAKGINKLHLADVVLLDMIFSEQTTSDADDAVGEAISSLNASICGFFLRKNSTQTLSNESLEILDDSTLDLLQSQVANYSTPKFVAAPFVETNILPVLKNCTLSGSFSTLADSDELFRSYPIAQYYDNKLFASLGVQALRVKFDEDISRVDALHINLHQKDIKIDEKGFAKLNFYKKEQYSIVSFLDVSTGVIKPEFFKDKLVILGITEIGVGDVVSTPIGRLYGPLMHYTFLSNFLQGHLLKEYKTVTLVLICLMIFIPFILMFFIKKSVIRVFSSLFIYLLILVVSKYLFIFHMLYIDLFYPLIALFLSGISMEIIAFNQHEKNIKFIREAFSAYLSPSLLKELIKNPKTLTLGGEKKELSVLFSDIRGFTNISEKLHDVQSLVLLLNRYFTPMTESVLTHQGMLDKYIGDAVMAFYNAPVNVKNHADKACFTALDMISKLQKLNEELKNDPIINQDILPIKIGIGINTANIVVGNIGSNVKFNYTVMGDGVNLCSRIEALTKEYAVDILITEFTVAKLSEDFIYREIQPVVVKGKDEAVTLYELMPFCKKSHAVKKIYDNALKHYKQKKVLQAEKLFKELVQTYDDKVSLYFLNEINNNKEWSIRVMTTK